MRVKGKFHNIKFLNVYSLTEGAEEEYIDTFTISCSVHLKKPQNMMQLLCLDTSILSWERKIYVRTFLDLTVSTMKPVTKESDLFKYTTANLVAVSTLFPRGKYSQKNIMITRKDSSKSN